MLTRIGQICLFFASIFLQSNCCQGNQQEIRTAFLTVFEEFKPNINADKERYGFKSTDNPDAFTIGTPFRIIYGIPCNTLDNYQKRMPIDSAFVDHTAPVSSWSAILYASNKPKGMISIGKLKNGEWGITDLFGRGRTVPIASLFEKYGIDNVILFISIYRYYFHVKNIDKTNLTLLPIKRGVDYDAYDISNEIGGLQDASITVKSMRQSLHNAGGCN